MKHKSVMASIGKRRVRMGQKHNLNSWCIMYLENSYTSWLLMWNLLGNLSCYIKLAGYTFALSNPCPSNWSTHFINPLFEITSASSALIVLRSSMCRIRQQLDKRSVVQPTRLSSSNREASLRGHERLKDRLEESG